MSERDLETFLARLYVDADIRARFRQDPLAEARRAGLSEEEYHSLGQIDWVGLEMAAASLEKKRQKKLERSWARRLRRRLRY